MSMNLPIHPTLPWCIYICSHRACVFIQFSSVQFSCSVVSDSLRPYGLQHARLPCPSPTPGIYSNSCPLSLWCHWKVVAKPRKTLGFLASRGEEFNPGPEMRLDCSELLCNKGLLKHKGHKESFWHRHQKGQKEYPLASVSNGIIYSLVITVNQKNVWRL